MPYIRQEDRPYYEAAINTIVRNMCKIGHDAAKGNLNYVIFSIIKRYLELNDQGMRYHTAQDMIGGVLTSCQLELYRRLLVPYEEQAASRNGDV